MTFCPLKTWTGNTQQITRGKDSQLQAQTEESGTVESNYRIPAKEGQDGISSKRKGRW